MIRVKYKNNTWFVSSQSTLLFLVAQIPTKWDTISTVYAYMCCSLWSTSVGNRKLKMATEEMSRETNILSTNICSQNTCCLLCGLGHTFFGTGWTISRGIKWSSMVLIRSNVDGSVLSQDGMKKLKGAHIHRMFGMKISNKRQPFPSRRLSWRTSP